MKKKLLVSIVSVLIVCSGCGQATKIPEETKNNQAAVEAVAEETEEPAKDSSEKSSEGTDIPLSEDELNIIAGVDEDKLFSELSDIFVEIGYDVRGSELEYVNFNNTAGHMSYNMIYTSDGKPTLRVLVTFEPEWARIASVDNRENGHVYWIIDNMRKYTDIYDYKTDELISPAEKEFVLDEFMDDYQRQMDAISEEYQDRINDLIKEQGYK